jgi:serine/threonine-protein kinase
MASAAVLPFADLSPAHDQEYFSDGLTDELITTLSKVPDLRVAADVVLPVQGPQPRRARHRPPARRRRVIEGSVRRSGSRLRVSAELIDTRNGNRLWSESYDREASDIFAVQEDLARRSSRHCACGSPPHATRRSAFGRLEISKHTIST